MYNQMEMSHALRQVLAACRVINDGVVDKRNKITVCGNVLVETAKGVWENEKALYLKVLELQQEFLSS